jgi:hypothetical protein
MRKKKYDRDIIQVVVIIKWIILACKEELSKYIV